VFDARVRWGQSHRSGHKWLVRVREVSAESRARRGKWGTLLNRLDKPTLRRQPDASMKARDIGPLSHPSGEQGQVRLDAGGAFGSPSTPATLRGRLQLRAAA
jgi:hypothetical protein